MNNVMTINEIEKQFDSEWVLVEDPQTDENLEVLSGNVVAHSKDRDEIYRFAIQRKPARSAIVYTGTSAEDICFRL